MRKFRLALIVVLIFAFSSANASNFRQSPISFKVTSTPAIFTSTPSKRATSTPTNSLIPTDTVSPTSTLTPEFTYTPTVTTTSTLTPTVISTAVPYPNAPLCPDSGANHPNTEFHTLWDSTRGCHYDHEHGQNPFVPQVASAFAPLGDLRTLLGGVEIGHTNPSSPLENIVKHGGFKWTVSLSPNYPPAPISCITGFEGAQNCVTAAVIEHHGFGDANLELEASPSGTRIHSAAALIRQGPLNDPGYLYVVQNIEYGEICAAYQGALVPYPNNFNPPWNCAFGQYWTTPCIGSFFNIAPSNCASTLGDIFGDADSIVTSKITSNVLPPGPRPQGSTLFKLLWRVRDSYQAFDANDLDYPFTYRWICSDDGGATYNPLNCYYNNSTARVHEIGGAIPAEWDNLSGFDTDARTGRITADGFVTRFGNLNLSCSTAGVDCFPIKMVGAYIGTYGGTLSASKISNTTPQSNPERDIYFCNGVVCSESSFGAVSSGWIGPNN